MDAESSMQIWNEPFALVSSENPKNGRPFVSFLTFFFNIVLSFFREGAYACVH